MPNKKYTIDELRKIADPEGYKRKQQEILGQLTLDPKESIVPSGEGKAKYTRDQLMKIANSASPKAVDPVKDAGSSQTPLSQIADALTFKTPGAAELTGATGLTTGIMSMAKVGNPIMSLVGSTMAPVVAHTSNVAGPAMERAMQPGGYWGDKPPTGFAALAMASPFSGQTMVPYNAEDLSKLGQFNFGDMARGLGYEAAAQSFTKALQGTGRLLGWAKPKTGELWSDINRMAGEVKDIPIQASPEVLSKAQSVAPLLPSGGELMGQVSKPMSLGQLIDLKQTMGAVAGPERQLGARLFEFLQSPEVRAQVGDEVIDALTRVTRMESNFYNPTGVARVGQYIGKDLLPKTATGATMYGLYKALNPSKP